MKMNEESVNGIRLYKKQLIIPILLVLMLLIYLIISLQFTPVKAEGGGPVEIGYLVDEDFSLPYPRADELKVSGWDIRRAGGSLAYSYNNWFKIVDSSTVLPVSMSRAFLEQSVGKLTLEYRFKLASMMNDVKWQLLSNDSEAVSIITENSNLVLQTSGGQKLTLQSIVAGVEYGVKVIVNMDNCTTDVYVNGVLKATAASFKQTVTTLNRFQVATGATSMGEMFLAPVKIYKGYVVNEKFISVMPGSIPGDWQASANGGAISIQEMKSSTRPDVHSLKMDAANSSSGMSVVKTFGSQTDNMIFEYKVLIPQKTDGLAAEIRSGSNVVVKVITNGGKISYVNGAGQSVDIYDYKPNLWYHMKVVMNSSASKADIYINGKLQAQQVDFSTSAAYIDRIQFSTSSENKGIMWLDDITLYKQLALPEDYVPAPTKVSSGQTLIGAQTCSMWREGHHFGWDTINPYPERKPVLGFYDEGNPETADWEIKYSVEHGIDFQMYCWFRPTGGEGTPIKDPYLGFALHDGFFNAQYSNQMKFAIMWEAANSRVQDSADFRNNVVPYWIEYYFKDPRYVKVGNKPVLSIYSFSNLKKYFGGTIQDLKAELDYLRTAVQNAGFDDIILINNYSGQDTQELSDRKSAGFDAIYAYNWGYYGAHADYQETFLTKQRDANLIDVVPTISMGRDDTAWGLSSGYYTTVSEFQSVAEWTRDTFVPSLPSTSLGKSIILIDNWNEYGEGHYVLPSGLAGFGYLDVIRNVFTNGGAHPDIVPTQTQKNRINALYPSNRVLPNKTIAPPPITGNYAVSWEFNTDGNDEGWGQSIQTSNMTVTGGVYAGTSIGIDPILFSPNNLNIQADDVPYIKIRMNSSTPATGKIYFITEADQVWNESKSEPFYVASGSGFTDVYISMWKNKGWKGNVKKFRIDPMESPGTFAFDSIAMVHSVDPGIRLFIDGSLVRMSDPPVKMDNVIMVPAAEVLKQIGATVEWDKAQQTVIAAKDANVYRISVTGTTYKNNQLITLDHTPVLLSNGTMQIPATFFNQAFGYSVASDDAAGLMSINTTSLSWEFNGNDGWLAHSQVSNGLISGGYYSGMSSGTEPTLVSPDSLYADASTIKRIRIKLKNSTSGSSAKLYYTTASDPVWNSAKMMTSYVLPNDPSYREYVFDTTQAAGWSGLIKQIRLVPANATGNFSIDSVILDTANSIPVKGSNLIVDPGMETSTLNYTGWEITRELSTAEFHSGHQSMKVTKTNVYGSIQFPAAITKGNPFYYSAWAKLPAGATAGKEIRLCLKYNLNGVEKQLIILNSPSLNTTEWKQVQGIYTINESGTVSNVVMYMFTSKPLETDVYYLDDVEIRPVTYTTSPTWINVTNMTLNKSAATLTAGNTETLSASIVPSNAVNKDVVWYSDNTNVATVDNNGIVYAKSAGSAIISAITVDSGKSATCTVTVVP